MNIKNIILDILFPRVCVECGKKGEYICERCSIFISECEQIDGLTSVWDYEGVIKKLIWEIKYNGLKDGIKELVERINFRDEFISLFEYITYVPMYRKREKYRGFNQSKIIATELGKKYNLKVVCLLKKIKDTEDQVKLDKEERLRNVRDSFEIAPQNQAFFRNFSNILLVDDVFTTGATMRECCRVLKKSGIKNIWGFTLAKTP